MVEIFTISMGGVAGGMVGLLLTERRLRQWKREQSHPRRPDLHTMPFPEDAARHAAHRWANESGVPEAEGVVLGKLRLGWQLQEQRRRGRRRAR